MRHFANDWKHHTGDTTYPVESATDYICAPSSLWKDKRGKLRRSLCRYMAKKIEAELK